jgi:hypothetical protein
MSAFQSFYETLHQQTRLAPPPVLPSAPVAPVMPGVPAQLPRPFVEGNAWFRRYPDVAPRAEDAAEPGPPPPAKQPRQRSNLRSLKQDLLEQLDEYQIYAKRLRKWDVESYQMFRRLGMYVPPSDMLADRCRLEPAVLKNPPGFGAVAIGLACKEIAGEKERTIPARFCYFRKLDRPGSDIERRGEGVIYRAHLYWDDHKDKVLEQKRGFGIGRDFAVHLAPDGTIHALRMRQPQVQVIRHKHGRYRGHESTVVHQRWGLPDFDLPPKAVAERIAEIFILTMNFWVQSAQSSAIRVTATKGDVVMPFVVDVLKTPEFFRDREPVVIDGKTRRIFHIVRGHIRHTRRGAVHIKTHFSGLRSFRWNGYQVAISVPGRDHGDLADITFGCLEDVPAHEEASGKFAGATEMAEIIADAIGAPQLEVVPA